MAVDDIELVALTTARDVLQKQIDERVALRRQEMLLADSFYRERKTRRLAAYFSELGFRIVSCVGKEQVLAETRAANLLFKIKEIAMPVFKKLVAKDNKEVSVELDGFDGADKSSLLQLCDAFEKLGWIRTERTRHALRIVRLNDRDATCFWHGSWAEYVNRSLVVKTLQTFANSRKFRFDVFYDIKLARWESTGNRLICSWIWWRSSRIVSMSSIRRQVPCASTSGLIVRECLARISAVASSLAVQTKGSRRDCLNRIR